MSPLLIFLLVVLFLVGGLLVLRDTAFVRGQKKPAVGGQRRARRDHRQQSGDSAPLMLNGESAREMGLEPGSHNGSGDSCDNGSAGADSAGSDAGCD